MAKHNRLKAEVIEQIRDKYVQGFEDQSGVRKYPTLRELAEEYNSSAATLSRHKSDGGWDDARAVFETKLAQDRDDKRRREMIQQAVDFDSNSLLLARRLQSEIGQVLKKIQRQREIDPEASSILGSSQIAQLANALSVLQRTGRLALGESTENTNIGMTQNAETLNELFEYVESLKRSGEQGISQLH